MDHSDDRADETLPVTAEVGGEGGSYADATQQAETFQRPVGNVRVDPKAAGPGAEAPAIRSEPETLDQRDDVPPDKA
jgi:hypothetical protein